MLAGLDNYRVLDSKCYIYMYVTCAIMICLICPHSLLGAMHPLRLKLLSAHPCTLHAWGNVLSNSYTMCARGSSAMSTLSPRASGVHTDRANFLCLNLTDELIANYQICQNFPIKYLCYVYGIPPA